MDNSNSAAAVSGSGDAAVIFDPIQAAIHQIHQEEQQQQQQQQQHNRNQRRLDPPGAAVGRSGNYYDYDNNDNNDNNDDYEEELVILPNLPGDPRRMELAPDEREWALQVKAAIEAIPELDNLSDFMYVHIALFEEGNLEAAVERARRMQQSRQEFLISDDLEQGMQLLAQHLKLLGDAYFILEFVQTEGRFCMGFDVGRFHVDFNKSPEKMRFWIAGIYYLFHAFCCDFEAITKGIIQVFECEGYSFRGGLLNLTSWRKIADEMVFIYPMAFHKARYFNAGMFMNTFLSLCRKFIPDRFKGAIQLGFQCEMRLNDIFLQNKQVALQKMYENIFRYLRLRYENEKNFSLSNAES